MSAKYVHVPYWEKPRTGWMYEILENGQIINLRPEGHVIDTSGRMLHPEAWLADRAVFVPAKEAADKLFEALLHARVVSSDDFEREQENSLRASGLTLWKSVDGERVEVPFTTEWPVHAPRSFAGLYAYEKWVEGMFKGECHV